MKCVYPCVGELINPDRYRCDWKKLRTEGDLTSRHDSIAFAEVKCNLWKKYENEIIGK